MHWKLFLPIFVIGVNTQFVEETDDIGRVRRQLLQEDGDYPGDVEDEVMEETTTTTTTTTEEPWDGSKEISAGPTKFYYEMGNLPKFLMEVENGIELTIYQEGVKLDTFVLEQGANGGITGSRLNNPMEDELDPSERKIKRDDFTLNLDYKNQNIVGLNGQRLSSGFMITFKFERKGNMWKMVDLVVTGVSLSGSAGYHDLVMGGKTVSGDKVEAPVGLSFACSASSHFTSNKTLMVSGAIKFPGWRMQVFEVRRGKFGPMWECGELMSIGLWVGLLVTLGFTLVCAWGFSMLASINTMDRFDDPKGKTIHIPQTAE